MKKVQNVILDMGNVIIEFSPDRLVRHYTDAPQIQRRLVATVFHSPEYLQLDMGTITQDAAIKIWQDREPELAQIIPGVADWFEHKKIIVPTNQLAVLLKAKGYGVYLLSNASDRFYSYRDTVPALTVLDGVILSCAHHVLKPDHQLYQILFDTYHLDPATCFFVDDIAGNVEAGRALGMDGFVFPKDVPADMAVRQLLAALKSHGIDIDYSEVEAIEL